MKNIMKNILRGIGLGSVLFIMAGIVFDILHDGNFALANWSFTKMGLGSVLVGLGFSLPSLVYESDKLPFGIQALIHMGIGCTIYLAVAFFVGWIPLSLGWGVALLILLGQLLVAFVIWVVFVCYYRWLAGRMNRRIASIGKRDS